MQSFDLSASGAAAASSAERPVPSKASRNMGDLLYAQRSAMRRGDMHPDDELASLRRLLDALESGSMKLLQNGRDVTQEEVAKLKPDIEYLEAVLARIRSSGKSHA